MSIEVEITVTVASVEVTDDYGVELAVWPDGVKRRAVSLSSAQALALARELSQAAADVEEALRADLAERDTRAHGFDVAPICRECGEGKHGACDGQAMVEVGRDVTVVPCGCAGVGHDVIGGAA